MPDSYDYEEVLEHLHAPRLQSWLPHDPIQWAGDPGPDRDVLTLVVRDLPGNTVMGAVAGLLRRWLPTYELMLAELEPGSFQVADAQFTRVPLEWNTAPGDERWERWKRHALEDARSVVDLLADRARGAPLKRAGERERITEEEQEELLEAFRFLSEAGRSDFLVNTPEKARRSNWLHAFGKLSEAWLYAVYGIRRPRSEWGRSRTSAYLIAQPIARALFYFTFGSQPARHDRERQRRAEAVIAEQLKAAMPIARGTIAGRQKPVGALSPGEQYLQIRDYLSAPRRRVIADVEHELLRPGPPLEGDYPDYERVDGAMENLLLEEAFRCAGSAVRMVLERVFWVPELKPGTFVDAWVGRIRAALDQGASEGAWLTIGSWALEYAQVALHRYHEYGDEEAPEGYEDAPRAARAGAAYDAAHAVAHYAAAHLGPSRLLTLSQIGDAGPSWATLTTREHLAAAVGEASASWAWSGPHGHDDLNLRHDFWDRWWARCRASMGAIRRTRAAELWTYPE